MADSGRPDLSNQHERRYAASLRTNFTADASASALSGTASLRSAGNLEASVLSVYRLLSPDA